MTPELIAWGKERNTYLGNVLEIGAFNVNGTMRDAFPHKRWFGVDLRSGPDVDFICDGAHVNQYFDGQFDGLVIAEALEHCEDWRAVLKSGWDCLRRYGYAVITAPGHDFPRHDFPSDFWRFSPEIWSHIFSDQYIIDNSIIRYPHIGTALFVQKYSDTLHLNIEPLKVKT